jgi:hypothetical protein
LRARGRHGERRHFQERSSIHFFSSELPYRRSELVCRLD